MHASGHRPPHPAHRTSRSQPTPPAGKVLSDTFEENLRSCPRPEPVLRSWNHLLRWLVLHDRWIEVHALLRRPLELPSHLVEQSFLDLVRFVRVHHREVVARRLRRWFDRRVAASVTASVTASVSVVPATDP